MATLTWRFLLTCFLLIAMYFQGIAQASMIACDYGHANHNVLIESVLDSVQTLADDAGHPHHAATVETPKAFKDKCNHCAPCCIAAAILPQLAIVIAPPVVTQDFPALTVVEHSTKHSRIDRPPRAILP